MTTRHREQDQKPLSVPHGYRQSLPLGRCPAGVGDRGDKASVAHRQLCTHLCISTGQQTCRGAEAPTHTGPCGNTASHLEGCAVDSGHPGHLPGTRPCGRWQAWPPALPSPDSPQRGIKGPRLASLALSLSAAPLWAIRWTAHPLCATVLSSVVLCCRSYHASSHSAPGVLLSSIFALAGLSLGLRNPSPKVVGVLRL